MPLEELLAKECLMVTKQLAAAVKALEWYADERKDSQKRLYEGASGGIMLSPRKLDRGHIARRVLAEIKELGEQPDDD